MLLTRRAVLAVSPLLMTSGLRAVGAAAQAGGRYGLIGRMTAAPGRRDDLIAILLDGVAGMPGCLSYIVARDVTDADAIWITEVWDSAASHQASLSLPAVRAAIAKGRPLIAAFASSTETAPVGGHGLTAATPAAAEAEVRAALALFLTAFERLEWEPFRQSFADDATVFFPAPSPPHRHDGRAAVEAGFTAVFAQIRAAASGGPPFQRLVPEDLQVTLLGPDTATATFHLRNPERLARRTVVMARRAGAWRIVHLHATNVATGTATPAPAPAPPTFVNHVWRVRESTAVAPGQLYVFLSDGTLVITSPTGTPAFGTWKPDGTGLTMVEDGRPYRVDVLGLTGTEFSIRSHNPGTPVDIRFVRADGVAAAPGGGR